MEIQNMNVIRTALDTAQEPGAMAGLFLRFYPPHSHPVNDNSTKANPEKMTNNIIKNGKHIIDRLLVGNEFCILFSRFVIVVPVVIWVDAYILLRYAIDAAVGLKAVWVSAL